MLGLFASADEQSSKKGERPMSIRFQIAVIVFLMVQAVVFGFGAILVLATPLSDRAMQLMPWVVVLSLAVSIPASWIIAPHLRARNWSGHRHPR
jgi:hypothetical protein